MCGIVGIISYHKSGITQGDHALFRQMLYLDTVRGPHGTGVFVVDERGSSIRSKIGGPPSQLFADSGYYDLEKFVRNRTARFIVGHNRYATKGGHTTANAHPFKDQHITLVHNGTLEFYSHLPDYSKYTVDSELLCHAIAVEGVEKVIPTLEGAWSLVWYDAKDKTLNILKNGERPLFMATHKESEMFFFASERGMLEWVLDRNLYWNATIEDVPVDQLISFPLDGSKTRVKELKGKSVPKKTYFEGVFKFDNASEVCSTDAKSDCGLDQIPQQRPLALPHKPYVAGEWARGQTGKVKTPASKINVDKASWTPVEHLHELSKGMWVIGSIIDYDLVDGSSDFYQVRCTVDMYPDIDFRCNVRGKEMLEALLDAPFGLRGKIITIQKSQQPPAINPHRVILNSPEPATILEPQQIPPHAMN